MPPRERQKLQPRPEYERGPYNPREQYPEYERGPYKPVPMPESGLMLAMANSPAVNKMKNIYSQVDPFFPNVDPIDQQIGYDFDKNLWGGTLGFGGEYDIDDENYNAYINWGTNW